MTISKDNETFTITDMSQENIEIILMAVLHIADTSHNTEHARRFRRIGMDIDKVLVKALITGNCAIDCGTNTELFLTLASMSSDTDKGQWFVTEEPISIGTNIILIGDMFCLGEDKFDGSIKAHRATAKEIVEHFNRKTK